jgi:glyoxylate reductase
MESENRMRAWASFDPPEMVVKYLTNACDFEFNRNGELATRRLIASHISKVDGIIVTLRDFIDAELIDKAPNLRVISNLAAGYDNIDVEAASRRGIWVTNTPDVLTAATADLAWALLLSVARRIPEGDHMVRSGEYEGWRHNLLLGSELSGKTLGIWGAGRIGQAIGRRATGFNLRVIYNNRSRKPEFENETRAEYVEFDELMRRSDFLVLAMPLNAETRNRIGTKEFELMKSHAILINIARGALIREAELIEVLQRRRIGGAGLDVYVDTTGIHETLGGLDHVVLTPHIGSATRETREKMAFVAARNLVSALEGKEPEFAVNRDEIRRSREHNAVRPMIVSV